MPGDFIAVQGSTQTVTLNKSSVRKMKKEMTVQVFDDAKGGEAVTELKTLITNGKVTKKSFDLIKGYLPKGLQQSDIKNYDVKNGAIELKHKDGSLIKLYENGACEKINQTSKTVGESPNTTTTTYTTVELYQQGELKATQSRVKTPEGESITTKNEYGQEVKKETKNAQGATTSVTEYEYDSSNTDASVSKKTVTQGNDEIATEYKDGKVAKETRTNKKDGTFTEYTINGDNKFESKTATLNNGSPKFNVVEKDQLGNVTAEYKSPDGVNFSGTKQQYQYDTSGGKIGHQEITNDNGKLKTVEYNVANNPETKVKESHEWNASATEKHSETIEYEADRQKIKSDTEVVKNPINGETTKTIKYEPHYDGAGTLVGYTKTEFDKDGKEIANSQKEVGPDKKEIQTQQNQQPQTSLSVRGHSVNIPKGSKTSDGNYVINVLTADTPTKIVKSLFPNLSDAEIKTKAEELFALNHANNLTGEWNGHKGFYAGTNIILPKNWQLDDEKIKEFVNRTST